MRRIIVSTLPKYTVQVGQKTESVKKPQIQHRLIWRTSGITGINHGAAPRRCQKSIYP